MVLPIFDSEERAALDPLQIGQVPTHGLTGRTKLLARLGEIQVATHAHEGAQHGNGYSARALGLVQIASGKLAALGQRESKKFALARTKPRNQEHKKAKLEHFLESCELGAQRSFQGKPSSTAKPSLAGLQSPHIKKIYLPPLET